MYIVKEKERENLARNLLERKKDPRNTVLHVNQINYMYNFINIVITITIARDTGHRIFISTNGATIPHKLFRTISQCQQNKSTCVTDPLSASHGSKSKKHRSICRDQRDDTRDM
jgi:hypothetical protein